jgi:hypothetical protein
MAIGCSDRDQVHLTTGEFQLKSLRIGLWGSGGAFLLFLALVFSGKILKLVEHLRPVDVME